MEKWKWLPSIFQNRSSRRPQWWLSRLELVFEHVQGCRTNAEILLRICSVCLFSTVSKKFSARINNLLRYLMTVYRTTRQQQWHLTFFCCCLLWDYDRISCFSYPLLHPLLHEVRREEETLHYINSIDQSREEREKLPLFTTGLQTVFFFFRSCR
jgi:hypothetical protein